LLLGLPSETFRVRFRGSEKGSDGPAIGFPICRSHDLVLPLNGRKFGNSFLQFSDTPLEIGHGGVTPLFAGLCASIEPHAFLGKLLKNLELARTKDNLGSPRKFSSNPSKIFDERLSWRGKGAQIQIQEVIEIAGNPSVELFFRPSLQVIGCRHDQIIDGVGVGFVQQCVLAKQLAAVADIFLGRIGHPGKRQITVIGDTVNTASRIERMTKPLGVPMLLSDSVVARMPGALQLGPPIEAPLKGKAAATVVFPCQGFAEPDTIFLVQSSFATIAQRAEVFAGRFYANLFEAHPEFRPLFRNDVAAQTKMLIFILGSAVRGLNRMQEQVGGLRALGERHLDYGVKRADYDKVASV
jgi:hypothetical protein